MKSFFRTFIISFTIFVLITGGIIYFLLEVGNDQNSGADNGIVSKILDKFKSKKDITFLLLGIDANDVSKSKGVRSDTIMVVKYDSANNLISMLSIPRDTKTQIDGRSKDDKINHAHAYGGAELVLDTVNHLLGTDIKYYVKVDYKLVKNIVDLIGGVEIDVPMKMVYSDPYSSPPLNINIKKGKQVLDGEKSLQYLRYRKGYASQDLGRIEAQQGFMKEAIKQGLKPANIVKLPQMIDSYFKNVDTNIPLDTIMKLSVKIKDIDTDNMKTETLPGEPKRVSGVWYFLPNEVEMKEVVNNLFYETGAENKE